MRQASHSLHNAIAGIVPENDKASEELHALATLTMAVPQGVMTVIVGHRRCPDVRLTDNPVVPVGHTESLAAHRPLQCPCSSMALR